MEIDTTLLRELFVITEKNSSEEDGLRLQAPSNRMSVNLQAGEMPAEPYVVRTCNMHSCVRLVSQMIAEYDRGGPMMGRAMPVKWHDLWDNAISGHERLHNDSRWFAIYHKGQLVHAEGKHHQFLDVIEKCDILNKGDYERSINMAENAFFQAGKDVTIEYDSNVALISIIDRKEARCSLVLRSPHHTASCNMLIHPLNQNINLPQVLSTAADIFEGTALSYFVGVNQERLEHGLIGKYSDEDQEARSGRKRINELYAQLNSFQNRYKIRYRPERPDFDRMIEVAAKYARDHLIEQEKAELAAEEEELS